MTRATYFSLILILGALTALGPFTIDMYLPGFPAIAKDLKTDLSSVGLSLSSYFVGISAGQLLYGPLLDRFGRKKPLYIGLLLYIVATIGCIFVNSIDNFVVLRFIQAIGSCAAAVASVAMVRDLFPVKDSAKVFSLLMLVVALSPMVAPTVGGYVTTEFGWHAVFIILTVMGILVLLSSILWLPGSYKPDTTLSLMPLPIIKNFLSVLKVPQFYTYTFTAAVAFSALFAYISGSPKIFMGIFQVSGKVYGWIFALLSVGFIGASQVNTLLLKKYTSEQIIPVALFAQSLTGIFFVIASVNGWLGLTGTIVVLFVFLCGLGFTNSNAIALALAPFERNAGTASSLMGALQMGIGTLASVLVSLYKSTSALPVAMVMAGAAVLALLILLTGRRYITKSNEVSISS